MSTGGPWTATVRWMVRARAWQQHEQAVGRLRRSYAAVPDGEPVRLAKTTSNLFRPRAAAQAPGLDVSGLTGVLAVDPQTRTADVQGMCTYERPPRRHPAARADAAGGPAAAHDHARRCGERPGHRVDQLPQRAAARVRAGDGRLHRRPGWWSRPGPGRSSSTPSPTATARWATPPGCGSRWSRSGPSSTLRHVRFEDAASLADVVEAIIETREHDGVRVDGLDGVAFSPTELYLTLATLARASRGRPATTPARRSTTAASASGAPTC